MPLTEAHSRVAARRIALAASILDADFARLGKQVAEAEQAGVDRIHVDVMDGHFVPNFALGPGIVRAIRRVTHLPIEVHLMVEQPDRFVEEFVDAGCDALTVHQESTVHLHRVVEQIKGSGKHAGVALNPATPAGLLEDILFDLDLVLVMTVNPGFGGQTFIPAMLPKIRRVRQMIDRQKSACELEVDGGIQWHSAPLVVEAGATVLAAGSALFEAREGITASVTRLLHEIEGNTSRAPAPSHSPR